MNKRIILATVILTTLGSMEASSTVQDALSPASKAYQKSRELEEQRRRSIREKIRASRLKEQQNIQTIESAKTQAEQKATREETLRKAKEAELARESEAKTEALEKAMQATKEKNKLDIINFLTATLRNFAEGVVSEQENTLNQKIEGVAESIARDTKYKEEDIEIETETLFSKLKTATLETQRKIRKDPVKISLEGITIEDLDTFKPKLDPSQPYSEFFAGLKDAIQITALTLFKEKLGWRSTEERDIEQMLREALNEYGTEYLMKPNIDEDKESGSDQKTTISESEKKQEKEREEEESFDVNFEDELGVN